MPPIPIPTAVLTLRLRYTLQTVPVRVVGSDGVETTQYVTTYIVELTDDLRAFSVKGASSTSWEEAERQLFREGVVTTVVEPLRERHS